MRAPLVFRRALPCALLLLAGCTDPYLPEVAKSPPSYLVVDGFLNAQGVTTIRLSHTYAVAAKTAPPAETKATVYIEDEAGAKLLLAETSVKGTYASAAQTLAVGRQYRLHLRTADGKEYASAFMPVQLTPAIDALDGVPSPDGLAVRVSTHDPANATHYYRWDYTETWEITPVYVPQVEYQPNMLPLPIISTALPDKCWGSAISTTILLADTSPLGQDVVNQRVLRTLPATSERLFTRYSILVQQQALTKEEYAYWGLLRKNTESIGTLFDPQPVQLTGNVRCLSNPDELALGFVGAHSLTEKRIFVERRQLPPAWTPQNGYEACVPPDTIWLYKPPIIVKYPLATLYSYFNNGDYLPLDAIYNRLGNIAGYTAKSRDCIDCRTRGTAVKPGFW